MSWRTEERSTIRLRRPARVLLVEGDTRTRETLLSALAGAGNVVAWVSDASSALTAIRRSTFDALVTCPAPPRVDGIDLLHRAHERDHDLPVVLVTEAPSALDAEQALENGAASVSSAQPERVVSTVARAVRMGQIARAKRDAIERSIQPPRLTREPPNLRELFDSAIESMGFAYQPIVGPQGTPFGHEALMRPREPELPSPESVLDAAEALGRLDTLGRRVRALAPRPFSDTGGVLFVNLHPRDLFDDDLIRPESPLVEMAPRVVLELTERCALGKLPRVRERVAEVRERGFRVAIDDLGAGAAGLEALVLVEPEFVKLDISLVRGVDTSLPKQRLVQSLTDAGKDLGMTIVAEGIETRAELDCVVELGCDLFQGFLLARPAPEPVEASWPS